MSGPLLLLKPASQPASRIKSVIVYKKFSFVLSNPSPKSTFLLSYHLTPFIIRVSYQLSCQVEKRSIMLIRKDNGVVSLPQYLFTLNFFLYTVPLPLTFCDPPCISIYWSFWLCDCWLLIHSATEYSISPTIIFKPYIYTECIYSITSVELPIKYQRIIFSRMHSQLAYQRM